jgi:CHASE3 domain sensor protein
LAERSAFKGHYRRAIDRYKDALFYLSREPVKEENRVASTERIGREIELLQARMHARRNGKAEPTAEEVREDQGKVSR